MEHIGESVPQKHIPWLPHKIKKELIPMRERTWSPIETAPVEEIKALQLARLIHNVYPNKRSSLPQRLMTLTTWAHP